MSKPKPSSSVMLCLGIAVGYAGNLSVPQRSTVYLIIGITAAVAFAATFAFYHKSDSGTVLDLLILDVGVATLITSRELSAVWAVVFLCLAVFFSFANVCLEIIRKKWTIVERTEPWKCT